VGAPSHFVRVTCSARQRVSRSFRFDRDATPVRSVARRPSQTLQDPSVDRGHPAWEWLLARAAVL
jgi:hypothetical protein